MEWSSEAFFGGRPRLGRWRLMLEACRLIVFVGPPAVETLALLGARAAALGGRRLPDCLERVCRVPAPLDTDDAVGAMRDGGKLTGLVGDLGLGLTKPVSCSRDVLTGGGLLSVVERVGLAAVASRLAGCCLSCPLALGLGSGRLAAAGVGFGAGAALEGALVAAFATVPDGRVTGFFLAGPAPPSLLFFSSLGLDSVGEALGSDLEVPADGGWVGSAEVNLGVGCSSSICLSGFRLGLSETAPTSLEACDDWDGLAALGEDSGTASPRKSVRAVPSTPSGVVFGVNLASISGFERPLEVLGSWLGSRCRPTFPFFSMATKLVRTFDRGRGDSELLAAPLGELSVFGPKHRERMSAWREPLEDGRGRRKVGRESRDTRLLVVVPEG